MNITLDIETIPTQDPSVIAEIAASIQPPGNISRSETISAWEREKKPAAILEAIHKTSLDGSVGEIIVIGWAIDDEEPMSISRAPREDRADQLRRFFNTVAFVTTEHGLGEEITWVGHNIRDFDLRFMYQQSVILGVRPAFDLPHNTRHGDPRVFDTMTEWAGCGNRIKLDRLCHALGFPGKPDGIDGSKVWEFVQAGRIAEVAAYCRSDVFQTREIWKRMNYEGYNKLAE
jgi:3'-5' exonuclease